MGGSNRHLGCSQAQRLPRKAVVDARSPMSDMVCDNCGSTEAVVHLTQIVNNQMSTHRLCEKCAAEKGLEATPEPSAFPLTDLLAQMGKEPAVAESEQATTQCSFCGLTFRDFRETGRLGCPHCYE